MPRYELSDRTSNKFWEIELSGKAFTTTYGRIGSAGQRSVKKFKTEAAAKQAYQQIVKEKVHKGYKLVGTAKPVKPTKHLKPDKRLDALLAIGALLAPKAKKLAAEVTHAFTDPQGYITAHEKRMNDRAIAPGDKVPKLPWIVLINLLDDAGVLCEIDWKTAVEDVAWNIGKLAKGFKLSEEDEDESTWEALERAGGLLRAKKLQLAQLDMNSDAYPLVVVPIAKLAALQKLAKQAKYGEAKVFGDELAAAKKDRLKRVAAYRGARATESAQPKPQYRHYARGEELWWIKVAQTAFDTGYDSPDAKYYESHYFVGADATKSAAQAQIAAWIAEGFAEIEGSKAKSHHPNDAYIGWTAPFPEAGRYFIEDKTMVRHVELRGRGVRTTGGVVGKNFGELTNINYMQSDAAAEKLYAGEIERHAKLYKPIDRETLVAKYK